MFLPRPWPFGCASFCPNISLSICRCRQLAFGAIGQWSFRQSSAVLLIRHRPLSVVLPCHPLALCRGRSAVAAPPPDLWPFAVRPYSSSPRIRRIPSRSFVAAPCPTGQAELRWACRRWPFCSLAHSPVAVHSLPSSIRWESPSSTSAWVSTTFGIPSRPSRALASAWASYWITSRCLMFRVLPDPLATG